MEYFVDRRINLTALHRRYGHNSRAVRAALTDRGLTWADANQFALFTVYGFLGPTEKQTLNRANMTRLSVAVQWR